MLPSYLHNELALRLRKAAKVIDPNLVSFLGLDLDAEPEEPESRLRLMTKLSPLIVEGKPIHGIVPFELTTSVLGETVIIDCRIRFIVTLQDHPNPPPGTPVRILSRLSHTYDWLEWEDFQDDGAADGMFGRMRAPRWVQAPLSVLLPPGFGSRMDKMIRDYALAAEAGEQPNI